MLKVKTSVKAYRDKDLLIKSFIVKETTFIKVLLL